MPKYLRISSTRATLFINFLFIGLILGSLFTNCAKPAQEDSASNAVLNDVSARFSGQLVSDLQSVSSLGEVWGYAYDPQNKSGSLKIIFYVDGPVGVGQYAGETQANVQSVGPNAGHFFSFKLPARFADSRTRYVVAYAVEARAEYTLYPGAIQFKAFTPKAQGFYNTNIAGTIQNSCTRCHSWNYMQLFAGPLIRPQPGGGGTATNNNLINRMVSGHNGLNLCSGNVNTGFCQQLQNWWREEFN